MLLDGIGQGREVHEMDLALVARSVQYLASLSPHSDSDHPTQSLEDSLWTTTTTPAR